MIHLIFYNYVAYVSSTQLTRNFPTIMDLVTSNRTTTVPSGRQYIFPYIEIVRDSYITKWMYRGELQENSDQQYPIFQLWDKEIVIYMRDEATSINHVELPVQKTEDGIVEFVPLSPVKADDNRFLGLYIPQNPTKIYFENDPTRAREYFFRETSHQRSLITIFDDFDSGNQLIPLVAIELCKCYF